MILFLLSVAKLLDIWQDYLVTHTILWDICGFSPPKLLVNVSFIFGGGGATNDDFWAEDGPSGTTPVDMDTGNPWDSSAPAAPVPETAFAAFDQVSEAPAGSSDWAAFNESEMKPVDSAEPADEAAAATAAAEPEPEASSSVEAAPATDDASA